MATGASVWLVLRKRYEVSEADTEPADLLRDRDLLTMEWPTKVSEADYQTMVAVLSVRARMVSQRAT